MLIPSSQLHQIISYQITGTISGYKILLLTCQAVHNALKCHRRQFNIRSNIMISCIQYESFIPIYQLPAARRCICVAVKVTDHLLCCGGGPGNKHCTVVDDPIELGAGRDCLIQVVLANNPVEAVLLELIAHDVLKAPWEVGGGIILE